MAIDSKFNSNWSNLGLLTMKLLLQFNTFVLAIEKQEKKREKVEAMVRKMRKAKELKEKNERCKNESQEKLQKKETSVR